MGSIGYDKSPSGWYSWYWGGTNENDYAGSTHPIVIPTTACKAPTTVSLSATTSIGNNVTLNWSDAAGGTSNGITGYDIYRREYNADSGTWDGWASYTSVSSSTANGSLSVPVPATLNNQYQYEVRTKGSAGASYYSGFTVSSNTVKRVCTLSAPSLSVTSAKADKAILGWTESTITGATGTPTYSIYHDDTLYTTTTARTITIPENTLIGWGGGTISFTVTASFGEYSSASSNAVSFTYQPGLTGATSLELSATFGTTTTVSWTAGKLSNGGEITYDVLVGDVAVVTGLTETSYTIPESALKGYTNGVEIKVRTNGAGVSVESVAGTFTYGDPHKTVSIYSGGSWVRCIGYYYTGGAWKEVSFSYYAGKWNETST